MHLKYGVSIHRRLMAACLILVFAMLACGLPTSGGVGTPTPESTSTNAQPGVTLLAPTQAQPTQAVPTAANPQPPAPQAGEVLIYMVALEDAGKTGPQIGCGDSLIPVRRTIEPAANPITAALNLLFSVKTQFYGESGLYNALYQSNLSVQSAEVDASGNANVALVGQYQLGGTCDTPRFKAQIEQTILSISGVNSTNILLNGVPIDQALSMR